ncbi:MAG: uracil phosphoribosyltransferase [archaeon]|nr:uracil phosphoribosyltransferase [archaeon]
MRDFSNVHILNHPLINHKVAYLRDVNTNTKVFREIITEVTTLMAYESLKDVPTEVVTIQTPFEKVEQRVIKNDSVAIVPILRAGLGMVDGIFQLFPTAKVGHIGLYRNEETLNPVKYYCKLPKNIEDKVVITLDPMLATGGSSSAAITLLKQHNCKKIKLMSIIAAPEGIEKLASNHPDVEIYVSTLDRCLNDVGYILPGLGDAGDRIFGTK